MNRRVLRVLEKSKPTAAAVFFLRKKRRVHSRLYIIVF